MYLCIHRPPYICVYTLHVKRFVTSRLTVLDKEMTRIREDREQELRSMRNKTDANLEFVKQENSLNAVKVSVLRMKFGFVKLMLEFV